MTAKRNASNLSPLPTSDQMAVAWLTSALDLSPKQLREMKPRQFKKVWYSVAFLYSGLHPDAATDHGTTVSREYEGDYVPDGIDERLLAPYYEESGWPVALEPLANEAWRRFDEGSLADDELYCCDAQRAGMLHRNPHLAS
ncbi:MAG: hypothetical protein AABP62_05365 [Planctomycetota bacterium]